MNTRFNYKPNEKRDSSKDDEFITYSWEKRIKVISTNKDGSVDKYVEEYFWKEEKNSWKESIKSFDLGSVKEQVMNHLTKGTPLVTSHVLPPADYTKLEKGAEIKREMVDKGLNMDQLVSIVKAELEKSAIPVKEPVVNSNEGA